MERRGAVDHFPASLRPTLDAQVTNAFTGDCNEGCLVAPIAAIEAVAFALTRLPAASDAVPTSEVAQVQRDLCWAKLQ